MNIKPDIFDDTATAFALKTDNELKKAKWLFTMVGNARLVNVGSTAANLAIKCFPRRVSPADPWRNEDSAQVLRVQ